MFRLFYFAVIIGAVLLSVTDARAGGFALRQQDTVGEGGAFAGVAAGGTLGSMFWNPATITQTSSGGIEVNASILVPTVNQYPGAGSTLGAFGYGAANDTTTSALLPTMYASWQLNPYLWVGFGVNAPYGLQVTFPDAWAGRTYALGGTGLATYNANPNLAIRVNDWLSLGFGAQIEYARATLIDGIGFAPDNFIIKGSGWGYGFTAGVTVTPTANTAIGVGLRSSIDQKINGNLTVNAALPATAGAVGTTIDLPDILSVGLRQRFADRWLVMGTVEWTNWSRIGTSIINQPSGAPATIAGTSIRLPFQYRDGWFYSAGAEYVFDDKTTLRGGVSYESSPVTEQVRNPLVPDNDQISFSAGLSYKVTPSLIMDASYTYIKVRNANIDISAQSGNPWFAAPISYVGEASVNASIFALGLRYLFDSSLPALRTKG